MDMLSLDILRYFFSFFNVYTICRLSCVCKRWKGEIESEREWKQRLVRLNPRFRMNGTARALKRMMLQNVARIRAFRRLILDPMCPESTFMRSIITREGWNEMCSVAYDSPPYPLGYKISMFPVSMSNAMIALGVTSENELARRVFGSDGGRKRWAKDQWVYEMIRHMTLIGVRTEDINADGVIFDKPVTITVNFQTGNPLHRDGKVMKIEGIHACGYMIAYALIKECGQYDLKGQRHSFWKVRIEKLSSYP